MTTVKLNPRKLLGFRISGSGDLSNAGAKNGLKTGLKVGSKVGTKT